VASHQPANVVILGCGRSGTSIFGELFETLPGYRYWSERYLADVDSSGGSAIALKVPRTTPGTAPPEGLSVELPELWAAVPAPRVVFWQVRHPLDAICSLRVGIDAGWNHHPRPADWQDWAERPLVERCAHHWATINGPGYDAVRDLAVLNRFEEMLADPWACARRTAATVGLDPDDPAVVEASAAWADRVQDTNNAKFVEAVTSRPLSRPDHRYRVGRWRENLTPHDIAAVQRIVATTAGTFGYDSTPLVNTKKFGV
jgi:hypothetical protein